MASSENVDKVLEVAGSAARKVTKTAASSIDSAVDTATESARTVMSSETVLNQNIGFILLFGLTVIVTLLLGRLIPIFLKLITGRLFALNQQNIYSDFIEPYKNLFTTAFELLLIRIFLLFLPRVEWYAWAEIPVSLGLALALSWLGNRLFKRYFDLYLISAAATDGQKINSEFLILAKLVANVVIVIIAIIAFAQTHSINVIGLFASLGVGGLAVAFAAQKTLEQLLGGIVIYVDRPFVVDDYIGLPDGTFGKVESIGLRSTKIRTSGKGTVVVAPNNFLTQATIENFTGAKKVMSIVCLNLHRAVPDEEQALIRQVILDSTSDVFGIDPQSTDIAFKALPNEAGVQAQVTFFILGSGNVSMDLRRKVLDMANENITKQLKEYGISFDIEDPTIYVDSPITI